MGLLGTLLNNKAPIPARILAGFGLVVGGHLLAPITGELLEFGADIVTGDVNADLLGSISEDVFGDSMTDAFTEGIGEGALDVNFASPDFDDILSGGFDVFSDFEVADWIGVGGDFAALAIADRFGPNAEFAEFAEFEDMEPVAHSAPSAYAHNHDSFWA